MTREYERWDGEAKELEDYHGLTEAESMNVIGCIGVDGLRHRCVAWHDTTLCGMKVKTKGEDDTKHWLSCFECTY